MKQKRSSKANSWRYFPLQHFKKQHFPSGIVQENMLINRMPCLLNNGKYFMPSKKLKTRVCGLSKPKGRNLFHRFLLHCKSWERAGTWEIQFSPISTIHMMKCKDYLAAWPQARYVGPTNPWIHLEVRQGARASCREASCPCRSLLRGRIRSQSSPASPKLPSVLFLFLFRSLLL